LKIGKLSYVHVIPIKSDQFGIKSGIPSPDFTKLPLVFIPKLTSHGA
jgi:hypothetical protein